VRTTHRGRVAAVVVGLALVAGACSSSTAKSTGSTTPTADTAGGTETSAANTTPTKAGGEVTYAQEEEGVAYNNSVGANNSFANTVVNNLLQPGPFITDDKLGLVLWTDFVTSAEVTSASPQTLEYKLNPKAVWSDGVAIDCKDFYLAYMAQNGKVQKPNPDYSPGAKDKDGQPIPEKINAFDFASSGGYEQIKSVTCNSPTDIVVVFDTPYADWKGLFGALVPAHILEAKTGVADVTKVDATTLSDDLVKIATFWSTGFNNWDPALALSGAWYKVQKYTAGEGIVLVKNDKFWGTPAKLDQITLKTITDSTAQATALQNNEIQAIQPQADPGVADQLKKATGIDFKPSSGLIFEHLDMNMKNPIFQDIAVRKAFAACVDRQDIIDKLVGPVNPDTKPLNSLIFLPNQTGYQDNFAPYGKFDIAASKSLLEGAGWKLGSDGVYAKGGTKLAFRISHKGIQRRSDTTQNVIASCKQAGFAISEDSDKTFNAARLPKGDFDVALFAWVGTPFFSGATGIYSAGGGSNYQAYVNDKIKPLYDKANAEFDDAKRLALMQQIDKLVIDDVVSIPLFQLPDMPAWSSTLQGPVYNGSIGLTWNAETWSLS
jgi:peptide/nickel transport system substrate-binding protein